MEIPEGWPTEEMVAAARGIPQIGHSSYYWRQVILNVFATAPTPPEQEQDEPVAYRITSHDGIVWLNSTPTTLRGHVNEPLYTHPDNSELRKAVAEYLAWYPEGYANVNINLKALRAALEGK